MEDKQNTYREGSSNVTFYVVISVLVLVLISTAVYLLFFRNQNNETINTNTAEINSQTTNTAASANTSSMLPTNTSAIPIVNTNLIDDLNEGESRALTEDEKEERGVGPELDVTVQNQDGEEVLIFSLPSTK